MLLMWISRQVLKRAIKPCDTESNIIAAIGRVFLNPVHSTEGIHYSVACGIGQANRLAKLGHRIAGTIVQ